MTRSVEPDKTAEGMKKELRFDGEDKSIWDVIDTVMRHVPEEA